ncbi:MAG TPA: hypothetical protein VF257_16240 [Solirubrobacteraceae bacterium]
MRHPSALRTAVLAVVGLALAVAVGLAANAISRDSIGLAPTPAGSGVPLSPARTTPAQRPVRKPPAKKKSTPARTTTPTTSTPTTTSGDDDHGGRRGSGSGSGSGSNSGRGGGDDD